VAAVRGWRLAPLIGVAGPDGSGKSTLASGLVGKQARGARPARALYLYGCVVCRRWRGSPLSAGLVAETRPSRTVAGGLRSVHALVDAGEMTVRLLAARLLVGAGGGHAVITDRTPLDALVKHDPGPRSLAGLWYLRLARAYQTVLWLDADAAVLAQRDREHTRAELADLRARFAIWARQLPNVVRVETAAGAAAGIDESSEAGGDGQEGRQ
jgi:ribosomal protein S11